MNFTLTVFESDDETVLFEVGTAADHSFPYLCNPDVISEAEIDLEQGKASIGQINIRAIDPQTGATQVDRFLTGLLGNASGFSAINGRRALLEQVDPPAVIIDGVAYGISLNDSYAGFSLQIRDIRERGREIKVFSRTGTSTVLPRGVLNGYGTLPNGEKLVPATTPFRGVYRGGIIHLQDGWKNKSAGIVGADYVYTDAMRSVNKPRSAPRNGTGTPNMLRWPHVELWWRPIGGAWHIITDVGYQWEDSSQALIRTEAGRRLDEKDGQVVEAIAGVWVFDAAAVPDLPSEGQRVEVMIVYTGPASEEYPFHFEGSWGVFVRNLLRGDYCEKDINGDPIDPKIRYDADALTDTEGPFAVQVRIRLTEPRDNLLVVLEELCKGIGAAPALNTDGEISPIRYALPDTSEDLPTINDDNCQASPGWDHPADNAITVVECTYPRDYRVLPQSDPEGRHSAGDGIASHDQLIIDINPEALATLGEQKLEIDLWMFRAIGGTEGQPLSGDVADELGAQIAGERQSQALDRFAFGGVISSVLVSAESLPEGVCPGSWQIDSRGWPR